MKPRREQGPLINKHIRATRVQLITHEGENIGAIEKQHALKMAEDVNLDLVQIAESGGEGIPVVKIMDFGKSLYEKKKKLAEAKKHQKVIHIKELKLRPSIGEHDYQTKMKQAFQFLKEGKRLKITLFFKGRENITKAERGKAFFEKIRHTFEEEGFASNLVEEKESRMGQYWSRIFYLKAK